MAKGNSTKVKDIRAKGLKLAQQMIKEENEKNPRRLFEFPSHEKPDRAQGLRDLQNFFNPFGIINEPEWITHIRDYCRENKILPTHLIDIHKEWTIREQKYNQTFKTEKAPE